jgi:hypothetical protein
MEKLGMNKKEETQSSSNDKSEKPKEKKGSK